MVITRQQSATPVKLLDSVVLVKPADSEKKRLKSGKDFPAPKRRRLTGGDDPSNEDTHVSGAHPVEQQSLNQESERSIDSDVAEQSGVRQLGHKGGAGRSQRKERRERDKGATAANRAPANRDTKGANSEEPAISNSKSQSTHVRFDSEEPPVDGVGSTNTAPTLSPKQGATEEAEDSDDEAPEDVSASAAQRNTGAAAAGIAKAVQQQRLVEKRKRQERAARLKEQTQLSAGKRKESLTTKKATTEELATPANVLSDDEELPELLPDEVLAEEFTRPPTPPPIERKQKDKLPMQRRPIQLAADPPKDIEVGPVNVSVLEQFNKLLPPKASSGGRSLREAWLVGRRGKGGLGTERKSMNSGFVKR